MAAFTLIVYDETHSVRSVTRAQHPRHAMEGPSMAYLQITLKVNDAEPEIRVYETV